MLIPPHVEARRRFHEKFAELIAKGCRRWQADREEVTEKQFERHLQSGISKLKTATFLKEECDDASRKFWDACVQGTKSPEEVCFATELGFQHTVERLKRSGKEKNGKFRLWFDREDLEAFEKDWEAYWEIEKQWLQPIQDRRDALHLFRTSGGRDALQDFLADTRDSKRHISGWLNRQVFDRYFRNEFNKSADLISAFSLGVTEYYKANDNQTWAIVAALEGVVSHMVIGNNVRRRDTWEVAKQWDVLLGGTSEWCTPLTPEASLFYSALSVNEGRHSAGTSADDLWGSWARYKSVLSVAHSTLGGKPPLTTNLVRLLTLEKAVECRNSVVRNAGIPVGEEELVRTILEKSYDELMRRHPDKTLDADAGEAAHRKEEWVEGLIDFIVHPENTTISEFDRVTLLKMPVMALQMSHIALINAGVFIRQDAWDANKAAEWIVKSTECLDGCYNYLAWSDVFAVAENYMERRKMDILRHRAVQGQIDLQNAACAGRSVVDELDKRLEKIEQDTQKPQGGPPPENEDVIRRMLIDGPPPLRRRRFRN